MNTNMNTAAIITIEPWQGALYQALRQPYRVANARREVAYFDGHRRSLQAEGDHAAVRGLATPLRYALTKYASVEAASPRALTRKVTTLAAHRGVWIDHPTSAIVIEAAVVSDAGALGLDAVQEGRLRRQLRGEG